MKKIIATFIIVLGLASNSCTDEQSSREALDNAGFSDIRFTGYDFAACGKDDSFSTGFNAKNPNGKYVSGTVCCGLFKRCTIRF